MCGKHEEAILTLERAVKLPEANLSHKRKLEAFRRSVLPKLYSYASVDAALNSLEILIPEDATWRFFRGIKEPSESLLWTAIEFDDRTWEEGTSGFGSRASIPPRLETLLLDMPGSYSTLYIRHVFRLADPSLYQRFHLIMCINDGVIAYLNGQEVARLNAGPSGTRMPFNGSATEGIGTDAPFEFWIDAELLKSGDNCLALQVMDILDYGVATDLCVIPCFEAEPMYDAKKDKELYDRFRVIAGDENQERVLAYLKGRVLQRTGKQEEALAKFEALLDSDKTHPEPYLRIAEVLRAMGDSAGAEARLNEAIEAGILARDDI
jgi:tetratricopeptide (TPR) repeat protein